jgi:hypothetical protein
LVREGQSVGQAAQFCLEPIPHPAERRMRLVLDLDPAVEAAAAVQAVAMFADQPFQAHETRMAKQLRADVALLEWRQMDAVDATREQPGQVGLAHRQRQLAKILAVADQDVEGVNSTS